MPRLMSPLRPRYMRVPSDPHELSGVPEKNADRRHSGDHPVGDTPAEELPEESSRIAEGTYRQIRDYSLVLLIPYLLWVTFAGYLNYGIYLLN